jgi:hypothetical protein
VYGVRLQRQMDLAGTHSDRNTERPLWPTRSFVAELSVRRRLERASGMGACTVSLRELRDEHPDTPGRDRVAGPFNSTVREASCNRPKKVAEVSKELRCEQAKGPPDP